MTEHPTPPTAPETKSFNGDFLLFRHNHGRPPRFRHKSFAAAETEAQRLLGMFPESTMLILQEVGRVKLKPIDPDAATGCGDDQTFVGTSAWVTRAAAGRLTS